MAQGDHKGPYKRGDERVGVRETDVVTEAVVAVLGVRGQECRLWKLEKASKSLPMRLRREPSPADTLILYFQPPELSDDKFVLFQATDVSAPVGSAYRWLFQLP